MSRIWERISPDRTLPPHDLWKDNHCGVGKITENRCSALRRAIARRLASKVPLLLVALAKRI
jgi:hypothetical protein